MTSKTFKSGYMSDNSRLEIESAIASASFHITHCTVVSEKSFMFNNTDAPALALAILEAAGVEPKMTQFDRVGDQEQLEAIADGLVGYIEAHKASTAEAKEQAVLEGEALALFNAAREGMALTEYGSYEQLDNHSRRKWLAVARKAREMRESNA